MPSGFLILGRRRFGLTVENSELILVSLWSGGRFVSVGKDFRIGQITAAIQILAHFLLVLESLRGERGCGAGAFGSFFAVVVLGVLFDSGFPRRSQLVMAQFKLSRTPAGYESISSGLLAVFSSTGGFVGSFPSA